MRPDLVLIQNDHLHGHFTVYAANLAQWAVARGFKVRFLGGGRAGEPYLPQFAGQDEVTFERRPGAGGELCRDVREAQKRLRPAFTFLVNADALFFESLEILDPGFRFHGRTLAVSTFGGRERHTCLDEPYTVKLNACLERRGPFDAILTLDEHHAASCQTGQRLFFLPDMFREIGPAGEAMLTPHQRDGLAMLAAFLDSGDSPVIPAPGKLDLRKNPGWLLRAALDHRDAAFVAVGECPPGPHQGTMGPLMERLRREGRLFSWPHFATRPFFDRLLSHPRVTFLPLAYASHFGSSAVALQAHEHGRPVLAPDQGLLARRIWDHGLGCVYRPGDYRDFSRAVGAMLHSAPAATGGSMGRFMACFSDQALFAALDAATGLCGTCVAPDPAALPAFEAPPAEQACRRALERACARRLRDAVEAIDEALSLDPGHGGYLVRKAALLAGAGRFSEAVAATEAALRAGMDAEISFLARLQLDHARLHLQTGDRSGAFSLAAAVCRLAVPDVPDDAPWGELFGRALDSGPGRLAAATWRQIGGFLAAAGEFADARKAFGRSLDLDPTDHDCRLMLSDVLRYAKRHDEALEALQALEAQSPSWPGLRHKRGQVFFEMGRLEDAADEFRAEPPHSPWSGAAADYLERIGLAGQPTR